MKKRMKHRCTILACALLFSVIALSGCNMHKNAADDGINSTDEDNQEITKTYVNKKNKTYDSFINTADFQASVMQSANIKKLSSVYQMTYQNATKELIETYKDNNQYTIDAPLMILNPYGTTTNGLYISFTTKEETSIEYTIHVNNDAIPDFTRSLYTNQDGTALKEHEGIIIGLVPGQKNTVTLRAYNVNGKEVSSSTFDIYVEDTGSVKEIILEQGSVTNYDALTDGLFVLFGYDRRNSEEPRHLLFYDNYGVLRAEIPLKIKNADFRIENVDGYLLFPCTDNQFVLMSHLGQVMAIYEATGYMFHHDFAYDKVDNKLVVLANKLKKKTKEDIVLTLDLNTGEWSETLDFENIFPTVFERAVKPEDEKKLDWIHFNTIMLVDSTDIILSSRELSSIVRVNDIYTTPTVEYIIAEPSVWEGTGYEDLLLTQVGNFSNSGGQHTVTYREDDSLEDGQYYLYMFNNNYGISVTFKDYDWSTIEGIGTPGNPPEGSYFYEYLIDTNKGTYELVKSFLVPYSRIVASSQYYDDHIVICSGVNGTFGEYTNDGELLAEYKMDVDEFTYRAMKYSMNQFWFNDGIATSAGVPDPEKEFVQGVEGFDESTEEEFSAFDDYSSSESNIKGNDYSDFE